MAQLLVTDGSGFSRLTYPDDVTIGFRGLHTCALGLTFVCYKGEEEGFFFFDETEVLLFSLAELYFVTKVVRDILRV